MNNKKSKIKRIYIAGKLNDMACDYIQNVHQMIIWSEKVRKLGFAVYVPGIDFVQGLIFGNWNYDDYFNNSQAWLDVSNALFVTPGWEESKGTIREIASSKARGLPVFYDLDELVKYKDFVNLKELR